MSLDESGYKFGSGQGRKFMNITVECYSENTLGIDQLSSQVRDAISTASIDGMELVAVSSDYAFTNPDVNKFHLKTITFTFDRE
jgi:hypothetical protein